MDDGLIEGQLWTNESMTHSCGACDGNFRGLIRITKINLPEGIKPGKTLIAYGKDAKPHKYLGIQCGCYARFHRQIVHIQTRNG